ncbi:hypothetical protein [Hymenobacter norwichensis]|uniref:hypothetical protein n=1 Tax=Hymenobacter norwichensis TaxID=223903 RepID=UPI0003B3588E|nr:hypothetical protein [Hymenobacter norwichensis]
MLPETLLIADHLTLTYRPDLEVLIARWHRYVTLNELQLGYRSLADEAERRSTVRWLLDTRALSINAEAGRWVNDVFYPTLAARFNRPVRMAYMVPPGTRQQLQTNVEITRLFDRFQKTMYPYIFQLFDQEGDAQRWLAIPFE